MFGFARWEVQKETKFSVFKKKFLAVRIVMNQAKFHFLFIKSKNNPNIPVYPSLMSSNITLSRWASA